MTEREKALAGLGYDPADAELAALRRRARKLVRLFNQTDEESPEQRQKILQELLSACGKDCCIESDFRCDYGCNIFIGDGFFANFNCVFLDVNTITIGSNVLLAPCVQLYTAYHPVDPVERAVPVEYASPIVIGDDVWLGGGAIVNPGVTIGSNVIIGSGSVVTRDIPSNSIAVGNPCRVIRKI